MALRQRIWAEKKRQELLSLLGRVCKSCGTRRNLTFDVLYPVDAGEHHQYEWSWRMSFYRKQHRENNLQVLCKRCNAIKGSHRPF